jgi:hypothetical protein
MLSINLKKIWRMRQMIKHQSLSFVLLITKKIKKESKVINIKIAKKIRGVFIVNVFYCDERYIYYTGVSGRKNHSQNFYRGEYSQNKNNLGRRVSYVDQMTHLDVIELSKEVLN